MAEFHGSLPAARDSRGRYQREDLGGFKPPSAGIEQALPLAHPPGVLLVKLLGQHAEPCGHRADFGRADPHVAGRAAAAVAAPGAGEPEAVGIPGES